MAPPTQKLIVPIDLKKKPWEQKLPLHNRWHPDIPSVATVKTGQLFRIEMVDCTGGAIKDDNSASDIKYADLSTVHYLSGPIRVVDKEGITAKPGDLLSVEICNLGPLPGDEWGFTGIFDRENGGGFLTDHFPCATKAIWYFEGIYAYSPHIPGVRFPGITHPGIIGTAPSMELLNIWNKRERELEENGLNSLKLCEVLHSRPLANLPSTKGCLLGQVYNNWDMHFSQGDGEVSFCGAIEMSGFLELKCEIIRGGMKEYLTPMGPTPLHVNPIFEIGPVEPRFSEWLVFEGISVDESGRQHYLDASVAYKRAVLNAIDYLSKFGYSKEQVYLLLSCCPCDGEVSFCGAIEMSGFLELKCEIIRGGMKEYLIPMGPTPLHVNPIFEIGPVEPRFSEWLVFEGISVDESGRQHYLDASVAYKRAVLNAIDYLSKFGYSKEQ
ncbi:formamidase-like isoform X2, partial [Tanacetum coccineum]